MYLFQLLFYLMLANNINILKKLFHVIFFFNLYITISIGKSLYCCNSEERTRRGKEKKEHEEEKEGMKNVPLQFSSSSIYN